MLGAQTEASVGQGQSERTEEAEEGQPYPRFGALLPREQCPKGRMITVLQPAVSRQAVHYNSFKTHLPPELLVPGHRTGSWLLVDALALACCVKWAPGTRPSLCRP